MEKKKLVLMRHGETLFNRKGRNQWWVDSPLTDLGIAQAKYARVWIDSCNFDFDHAYSSTSERASDTLELVTDMPYTRLKGLKEWNFGERDGEPSCVNPPVDQYSAYFKSHGGESREEVMERISDTLSQIMDLTDHHTVLVVSHGGAIRNFEHKWHRADRDLIKTRLHNCAVLVFDYDPQEKSFALCDLFNPDYRG